MNENITEKIVTEYLKGQYLKRFEKIRLKVQSEYANVFSCVRDPSKIPYAPCLYVIPFVITKEQRRGPVPFKLTYYNLLYIDPKEFDKFALFSSLDFLEKFPKYVSGGLGHEIAHLLQLGGKINLRVEDLLEVWKYPYQMEKKKEKMAQEMYGLFREPVSSSIRKWNELSAYPEIKDELIHDARIIDFAGFERIVFEGKQAELHDFIKSLNLQEARNFR